MIISRIRRKPDSAAKKFKWEYGSLGATVKEELWARFPGDRVIQDLTQKSASDTKLQNR
ncbi:hypothetical protein GCM10011513_23930 [Franconibacter daqui]|nr:hypothetical protein GCM10011513_23930 [Franconibacter daqui]